jgi:predicted 3-demethylubiquinone-9 3-methyltransferase (glyoxalase superfamily)
MQKVTPFLWFDRGAEEAARFYVSLLPDSRIDRVTRSPADTPSGPAGTVLTVEFTLAGSRFIALNGGRQSPFNDAVSFQIHCADQAEVDRLWAALSAGGSEVACGWLKDRWGLSWQVTPTRLYELLNDPDPDRSRRAMQAMMTMVKLDIAELERAADGA